jgi:hypothetical protein
MGGRSSSRASVRWLPTGTLRKSASSAWIWLVWVLRKGRRAPVYSVLQLIDEEGTGFVLVVLFNIQLDTLMAAFLISWVTSQFGGGLLELGMASIPCLLCLASHWLLASDYRTIRWATVRLRYGTFTPPAPNASQLALPAGGAWFHYGGLLASLWLRRSADCIVCGEQRNWLSMPGTGSG